LEIIRLLELVAVGLIAGTWGSLIGAGGGFLIVPILLFLYRDLSAAGATAVSLVAVFANGLSGAAAYARLRLIDYGLGLLFVAATLPGAVAGALLVNYIDKGPFQIVFGSLLGLVAIYLFVKPRSPQPAAAKTTGKSRALTDALGRHYRYSVHRPLGTAITFLVGFLASMLGVGGGIFSVPAFVTLLGIPIQVAAATSQFMLVGTSFVASATNVIEGDLQGWWAAAIALAIGSLAGGQIGPRIGQKFGSAWLSFALSSGLLLVAVRLVWNGLTVVPR
jgi:hypothetical protein